MSLNRKLIFLCLAFGFAAIGLLSMSSPLYSFNPWADANIYLTVGRQMRNGKMLYRDVFDHKGPYLYLIHLAAAYIDPWSFKGVYVMESIAASAYAFISLKTVRADTKRKVLMTLAGCLAVYGCLSFSQGDSAEEFCLPLLMASFYALETENYLLAGLMAGCVFWTKMTICSFYVGWYIVMLIRHRMDAIRKIPHIILGLLISSLPVAVMFFRHYDVLWNGYFASNIFYGLKGKGHGGFTPVLTVLCLAGCIIPLIMTASAMTDDELRMPIGVTALFLIIPMLHVSQMFYYYYLALVFYAPLWARTDVKKYRALAISLLIIPLAFSTGNLNKIGKPVGQMKFVNIMKKKPGRVLEFGMLDYGFYTLMHQNPESKYFFMPNMTPPGIEKAQLAQRSSLKYRYVVTRVPLSHPYRIVSTSQNIDFRDKFYLYELTR